MNSPPVCSQAKPNGGSDKMESKSGTAPVPNTNKPPGFCRRCASKLEYQVPAGDNRTRLVCTGCRAVLYENPKVVVACVPISVDRRRVLLGKRASPPQGKWTIPAGFLESGENAHDGAAREAREEMGAVLDMNPVSLLAVYDVLPANQVQLVYRCTLLNERDIAPGSEMEKVRMFEWSGIPWNELAFPTVKWALEYSLETLHNSHQRPELKGR
ncbi:Nudix hydrolase [Gracilaria domingensis]|nr:Nudix hydrolase [Gracilaria domingensis]